MKSLWKASFLVLLVQYILMHAGLLCFKESNASLVIVLTGLLGSACMLVLAMLLLNEKGLFWAMTLGTSAISLISFCILGLYLNFFEFGWWRHVLIVLLYLAGLFVLRDVGNIVAFKKENGKKIFFKSTILALPFGVGVIIGGIVLMFSRDKGLPVLNEKDYLASGD